MNSFRESVTKLAMWICFGIFGLAILEVGFGFGQVEAVVWDEAASELMTPLPIILSVAIPLAVGLFAVRRTYLGRRDQARIDNYMAKLERR